MDFHGWWWCSCWCHLLLLPLLLVSPMLYFIHSVHKHTYTARIFVSNWSLNSGKSVPVLPQGCVLHTTAHCTMSELLLHLNLLKGCWDMNILCVRIFNEFTNIIHIWQMRETNKRKLNNVKANWWRMVWCIVVRLFVKYLTIDLALRISCTLHGIVNSCMLCQQCNCAINLHLLVDATE